MSKYKFTRCITSYLEIEAKNKQEAIDLLGIKGDKYEVDWEGIIYDDETNEIIEVMDL